MNAFNEFGKPIDKIHSLACELEEMTRNLIRGMIDEGYSATDIRATAGYLAGCVAIADSEAMFHIADKIRRAKIANSDHNVSPEETALLKENPVRHKIRVIKMYRDRTGLGLKESKDAVEVWLKDNMDGLMVKS